MTSARPIRLALAGAGIFARNAHLPALRALSDWFEIAAIYSRTEASASRLAAQLPAPVDVYTDFDALLRRDDIEAVDIVLPINTNPIFADRALRAGKHVISEKPMASTVELGKELVSRPRDRVWMVAENWRYMTPFVQAAQAIHGGKIGKPVVCQWLRAVNNSPASPYYHTDWRQAGDIPGGFLLDGGVHFSAALRMALGEIRAVTAVIARVRDDMPPPGDSLSATLEFESGLIGNYIVSFAAGKVQEMDMVVVGEEGKLRARRGRMELALPDEVTTYTSPDDSVDRELEAFARAIRSGEPHRNSPEQALQDVAVVHAMLRAAQTGCRVEVERIV